MKTIKLSDLKLNDGSHGLPKNPRFIKDKRFEALCRSVKENPEFMPPRPIVVDEAGVILGGNMRYRACRELGMTEIPADWVRVVEGLSVEKKRRFIILDNQSFGETDYDLLANEWERDELINGGMTPEELGELAEEVEDRNKTIPELELFPYEHYDYVVVLADNVFDWEWLCEFCGLEKVDGRNEKSGAKVGLGRGVRASVLIKKIQEVIADGHKNCNTEQKTKRQDSERVKDVSDGGGVGA